MVRLTRFLCATYLLLTFGDFSNPAEVGPCYLARSSCTLCERWHTLRNAGHGAVVLQLRGGAEASTETRPQQEGLVGVKRKTSEMSIESEVQAVGAWEKHISRSTGKAYWWNRETGARQWKEPLEARASPVSLSNEGEGEGAAEKGAAGGATGTEWNLPGNRRDTAAAEGDSGKKAKELLPEDAWEAKISRRTGKMYWCACATTMLDPGL